MANFTGLAAGRQRRAGPRRVGRGPTAGSPARRACACSPAPSATTPSTWRCGTSGLGAPTLVAADEEGRIRVDALAAALDAVPDGDAVIVVPAGGQPALRRVRPVRGARADGARARRLGARRRRVRAVGGGVPALAAAGGRDADADSWATDAHKTLNVPYDCGIAVVARPGGGAGRVRGPRAATSSAADPEGPGDPYERVPELSRRARGVPVWAALRSLGRSGVRPTSSTAGRPRARRSPTGIAAIAGAEILNDVVFTQVCVAFGDDERTGEVGRAAARRRQRLDVRLPLARPRRAAGLGEQLVDRRGRRRGDRRGPAARGSVRLTVPRWLPTSQTCLTRGRVRRAVRRASGGRSGGGPAGGSAPTSQTCLTSGRLLGRLGRYFSDMSEK